MYKLIDLPYAPDALEPVISANTLSFHHGKHLQAYVDNLNKLLPGSGLEDLPLEEIVIEASLDLTERHARPDSSRHARPDRASQAIFNNAGQVLNHNLYFTQFAPQPSCPAPTGHLKAQIEKQWGSVDAFKAEFEAKGTTLFGSGWVWLAAKPDGELVILQCPGADNPVCHFERSPKGEVEKSLLPLLTFDVWEHAYYLDYQNRRAAHLAALWQIVNWKEIEERYKQK